MSYELEIEKISDLLAKRAKVYPRRDENYTLLQQSIQELANDLLKNTDFHSFQPNWEKVDEVKEFIDCPLFICGMMKSGTTLLTRLLDNHPNLLVMPADSHYVNHLEKYKRTQLIEIYQYWMQRSINPSGQEPFWFLGQEKEIFQEFLQHLYWFLSNTDRDIFTCSISAIYSLDILNLDKVKYWVEKTPCNELHVSTLSEKYSQAKFIQIVRDPLFNIASLKKLADAKNNEFSALQCATYIQYLWQVGLANQEKLGEQSYKIIKYEELVTDTTREMSEICQFLNIPFDNTLLVPTENGKETTSNSMYKDRRVTGRILKDSDRKSYESVLTTKEIEEVVTTLSQDIQLFDYNWENAKGKITLKSNPIKIIIQKLYAILRNL